jgi:hypothetical protein
VLGPRTVYDLARLYLRRRTQFFTEGEDDAFPVDGWPAERDEYETALREALAAGDAAGAHVSMLAIAASAIAQAHALDRAFVRGTPSPLVLPRTEDPR